MEKKMYENNEGFSLVELIVVVLIMAIIATALAPQVMQWVENSRVSADVQTRNTVTDNCKMALMTEDAFKMVETGEYELHIVKHTDGTQTVQYIDSKGIHTNADSATVESDPYWASLFKLIGADGCDSFEKKVSIKAHPNGTDDISIDVYIYHGGYTYGYLKGIENDVIETT